MTTQEFRELLKKEQEKEKIAKRWGFDVSVLDDHPFHFREWFDPATREEKWTIRWDTNPPPQLGSKCPNPTEIVVAYPQKPPRPTVKHFPWEDTERIVERLNELSLHDNCGNCGGQVGLHPNIMMATHAMDRNGFVGEIWAVTTVCRQCGLIQQFAIDAFGMKAENDD